MCWTRNIPASANKGSQGLGSAVPDPSPGQSRLTENNGEHLSGFLLLLLGKLPTAHGLERGPGFAIGHGLDLKDLGNLGVVFGVPVLLWLGRAVRSAVEAVVGLGGEGQLVVAGRDRAVSGPLRGAGAGDNLHLQLLGSAGGLLHRSRELWVKPGMVLGSSHPGSHVPLLLSLPPVETPANTGSLCQEGKESHHGEAGAVRIHSPRPRAILLQSQYPTSFSEGFSCYPSNDD